MISQLKGSATALFLLSVLSCEAVDPAASSVPLSGSANQFIGYVSNRKLDAVDLLFVIDSSAWMESKQEILAASIPGIIAELIRPECYDNASGRRLSFADTCPEGSTRVYKSVRSLNIGVISGSLGGQGAAYCPDDPDRNHNDRAHLVPSVRAQLAGASDQGVLKWRSDPTEVPELIESIQSQILAIGTSGCERQAPLEAWYRFLVEPRPPLDTVLRVDGTAGPELDSDGNVVLDTELLAQREAFLRPQSLLAVVMLSDDDDCSTMAGGDLYENAPYGHLMHQDAPMAQPSSACQTNPNDECCVSCLEPELAPEACDLSDCANLPILSLDEDPQELRCSDQRRRFGAEFIYPVGRYVDAMTRPEIRDTWSGELVDNPLLRGVGAHQAQVRAPGLVFPLAITGVPWHDVATQESLTSSSVSEVLSSSEMALNIVPVGDDRVDRWRVLLGDPGLPARALECQESRDNPACGRTPSAALDPFMIQSLGPRESGFNPITGDQIVGPESLDPNANLINGHEHSANGELALQRACIFPLVEPRECNDEDPTCACGTGAPFNQALCQPPAGGEAGATQYWDGASPSPRIAQFIRDMGANAGISSACPKQATGDPSSQAFGYAPSFAPLSFRLPDDSWSGFSKELEVDDQGMVSCALLEATIPDPEFGESLESPSCEELGRDSLAEVEMEFVGKQLTETGRCGGSTGRACEAFRLCKIRQLTGAQREACLTDPAPEEEHEEPGFCYIDPTKVSADGEPLAGGDPNPLVAAYPASSRRMLRTVGGAPAPNSLMIIACQE